MRNNIPPPSPSNEKWCRKEGRAGLPALADELTQVLKPQWGAKKCYLKSRLFRTF